MRLRHLIFQFIVAEFLGAIIASAQTATLTTTASSLSNGGGMATFTATITYSNAPTALGFQVDLPAGWSYVAGAAEPSIKPDPGSTGTLEWAYTGGFGTSVSSFEFTASYPAGLSSAQTIAASAVYRSPLANLSVAAVTLSPAVATAPPSFTQQPVDRIVATGESAVFTVAVAGVPAPTLHWQYSTDNGTTWTNATDGDGFAGVTTPTLTLPSVTAGQNGQRFRALASNTAQAEVASASARLGVSSTSSSATLTAPATTYAASGGTITFTAAISYSIAPTSLGFQVNLPPGWFYESGTDEPAIKPDPGTTGALEWAYSGGFGVTASAFTFTVRYPAGLAGEQSITAAAIYRSPLSSLTIAPVAIVPAPSPFLAWHSTHFTSAELAAPFVSGPGADPDSDGFSNLLEYALGLDPKAANTTALAGLSLSGSDWVYTYTRPSIVTDASYAVEFSTDLSLWTSLGVTHEPVATSGGNETWRGRYPLGVATNAFFRLKVSLPSGETSYAPPHGDMTIVVPTGQTRSLALPLWHERAGAGLMLGRLGGVGANYADVTGAGWSAGGLSSAGNPYYMRLLSGAAAGRVLPVGTTTNTDSRVFLTNDGVGLDVSGITTGASGDIYELVLADTLGSLFGSSILMGGVDVASADNVQIWSGASWLVFYYNTSRNRWERNVDTASSPTRDNFVLRPDRGLMVTRRAPTELRFHVTGRVPVVAGNYFHSRPGTSFLSNGLPKDITLGELGLESRVQGWVAGAPDTAVASADLVQVWAGASWLTFYYDSANGRWQRVGDATPTNRNSYVIPAGRPVMIRRLNTSGGPAGSLIALPLNYPISR